MSAEKPDAVDTRAVEEARRLLRSRDLKREWAANEALRLEAVSRQDFEEAARIKDENGPPHGTILYEVELLAEYVVQWSATVAAAVRQNEARSKRDANLVAGLSVPSEETRQRFRDTDVAHFEAVTATEQAVRSALQQNRGG